MKLFSCDWFPTSNTSEASTSIEGTLGGMRRRRNLQIAKANARTRMDHQNAIGGRKENWFVRVWKKVLESSISVGGKWKMENAMNEEESERILGGFEVMDT